MCILASYQEVNCCSDDGKVENFNNQSLCPPSWDNLRKCAHHFTNNITIKLILMKNFMHHRKSTYFLRTKKPTETYEGK